ncbi:MAG: hypothetical protein AAF483_25960, partial [Planctomycetota bacterium]
MSSAESLASSANSSTNWTPLIVYVTIMLLADIAVGILIKLGLSMGYMVLYSAGYGIILGQLGIIALIAGWSGRHWIQGFALATVLATTAYSVAGLASLGLQSKLVSPLEYFMVVTLIPMILTVVTIPFWISRAMSGRRLTLQTQPIEKKRITILDFFILTAFIGVQFYLYTIAMNVQQVPNSQGWMVLLSAPMYTVLSIIGYLPMGIIAFKTKDAYTGVGWQCLYAFALFVAIIVLIVGIAGSTLGPVPSEAFVTPMLLIGSATLSFTSGCAVLRLAGVRWAKQTRASSRKSGDHLANENQPIANSPWDESLQENSTSALPAGDNDIDGARAQLGPPPTESSSTVLDSTGSGSAPSSDRQPHITARILTKLSSNVGYAIGALLFLAFSAAVTNFVVNRSRIATVAAYNSLGKKLLAQGGEAFADEDKHIVALRFGPQADNVVLDEYTQLTRVTEIDLSGTQVDDAAVERILDFGLLRHINLANTKMSAAGIENFVARRQPESLVIAGIPLSQESLSRILEADKGSLRYLDISDCGLTYEHIDALWGKLPMSLSLRGFGLTDQKLRPLILRDSKHVLDLRNNSLTGDFLLIQSPATWRLRLEGNPITDAAIEAAADLGVNMDALSIGDNKLTDNCLAAIERIAINELTISDSSFNEAAINKHIISSTSLNLQKLAIHDPKFTGLQLFGLRNTLQVLDLSHSGVKATAFAGFGSSVYRVDLSHTQVDGKIVNHLISGEINLSHCPITAQSLQGNGF